MSRKKSTTKRTKNGDRTFTSWYLSFQRGKKDGNTLLPDWQSCARACRHTVWGRVTQAMNAIISGEWWTGKNHVAFYRRLEKQQQYTLLSVFLTFDPSFVKNLASQHNHVRQRTKANAISWNNPSFHFVNMIDDNWGVIATVLKGAVQVIFKWSELGGKDRAHRCIRNVTLHCPYVHVVNTPFPNAASGRNVEQWAGRRGKHIFGNIFKRSTKSVLQQHAVSAGWGFGVVGRRNAHVSNKVQHLRVKQHNLSPLQRCRQTQSQPKYFCLIFDSFDTFVHFRKEAYLNGNKSNGY